MTDKQKEYIKTILDLTKQKWSHIAMDKDGTWSVYTSRPEVNIKDEIWTNDNNPYFEYEDIDDSVFNLPTLNVEWEKSCVCKYKN